MHQSLCSRSGERIQVTVGTSLFTYMQTMSLRETTRRLLKERVKLDDVTIKDLEIGVYNWALEYATKHKIIKNWANRQFLNVYTNKARSMIANMDDSSYLKNSRLKTRLEEKEFLPHELPFMAPETVHPDIWRECIDRKLKKEEMVYEEKPAAMTSQFRCAKCKKRECVFTERQLRSCDEPMTLFISCINCGHHWKM